MYLKKHSLITVAGSIWFIVGLSLLIKGVYLLLIVAQLNGEKAEPLLNAFLYLFTEGMIPSAIFIIILGLLFGWLKGRYVLAKTAKRTMERIYPIQGPIKLTKLYRLHDYILVIGMIGLGRLLHWIEIPSDIHGLINVAIGSALINGAMIYFRFAIKLKEQKA